MLGSQLGGVKQFKGIMLDLFALKEDLGDLSAPEVCHQSKPNPIQSKPNALFHRQEKDIYKLFVMNYGLQAVGQFMTIDENA